MKQRIAIFLLDLADAADQLWPWVPKQEYEHMVNLHFRNLQKIYDQEREIVRLKHLVGEDTSKEYPHLI